jgi:uncharacterized tellurite resistance protein B-like protein
MFASLKTLFAAPADAAPTYDSRTAVAALLVRAAKSEGTYSYDEIRAIDRSLARHFGLNVIEAMKLRAEGEKLERAEIDPQSMITAIRDALDPEERFGVLSGLWEVVLTSDSRTRGLDELLNSARRGFGIRRAESQIAREHALASM